MDINKIKPFGTYGQDLEVPSETRSDSKRQSTFSGQTSKVQSSPTTNSLRAIAQFNKSDLSDPGKFDGMVRACASELIDSGQKITGRLSTADKQTLENFLSADPSFRQQLESYLHKTLT